jgi:hypothetical protein
MIAIGLIGIAGVAVMTLTESSNKEAKWGEMAFVKSEFVNSFGKYITGSRGCEDFKDLGSFSSPKNIIVNWKVAGLEGDPNSKKMEAGRKFKFFNVKELSAVATSFGGQNVSTDLGIGKKGMIKVKLVLQVKSNLNRSDTNAPNRDYSYEFNVPAILEDGTNKVLGCFENQTLQASCEALQGIIDTTTGSCKQKGSCQFIYSCIVPQTTTPSLGLDNCNTLTCPGDLVTTGGKSDVIPGPSGCNQGGKSPACDSYSTSINYYIKSCMVCEPQTTTSGGGGGTATGGGGFYTGGTLGGGGGFGFGSGSGSF